MFTFLVSYAHTAPAGWWGLLLLLLVGYGGAGAQVRGQAVLTGEDYQQLRELLTDDPALATAHSGFVLYAVEAQQQLFAYQADQFFVPASNVKLLTCWVANRLLGKEIPLVRYQETPSHYALWGTGYPLTLHPHFKGYDALFPWLAQRDKDLVLHLPVGPEAVPRYGAGWSWDDYNAPFVYEQSAFPIYGNRLYILPDSLARTGLRRLTGTPPAVAANLQFRPGQRRRIQRSEFGNLFTVQPERYAVGAFPLERPLRMIPEFMVNELTAALPERTVRLGQRPYPPPTAATTLTAPLPDTLYRRLLLDSDNFLAEQLLLMAATQRYGRPDKPRLLTFARDTLLPTIGVEGIRWVDGSGLSRYNLVTPRQLVRTLLALEQDFGREQLCQWLPAGGQSGTLKNRFNDTDAPYVWAKTGSLNGVNCLTGLLLTRKGQWLAFSFLQNNHAGTPATPARRIEKILAWCRARW